MQAEIERLLMRFLDGELGGEKEEHALRRIAGDPEARAMLRFDAGLRAAFREGRSVGRAGAPAVPTGFTDRVMRAIEAREATRTRTSWWSRPRTLVWRPVHALAAAAVLVLATLGAATLLDLPLDRAASPGTAPGEAGGRSAARAEGPGGTEVSGTAGDTVLVRFVFEESAARTVAVAGDFSRWEPIELQPRWREGRRVWTGLVAVPRGEHRYMFVVDGSQWVTDPLAPAVGDDGFGGRNAILSL